MRIHATINERTVRRTFREHKPGRYGLTVIDRDLPRFGFTVAKNGTKTFFVRVLRPVGAPRTILGTADEMTAAEARERAIAAIEIARAEHETGPLFSDFAADFMRRQGRRWKPSTREGNRHLIDRYLVPFFGAMRVADIDRADVRRWFDAMSGTPGQRQPDPARALRHVAAGRALGLSPAGLQPLPQHAALQDAAPRAVPVDG